MTHYWMSLWLKTIYAQRNLHSDQSCRFGNSVWLGSYGSSSWDCPFCDGPH